MSEKKLVFLSILSVSVFSIVVIYVFYSSQVAGIVIHPKVNGTMEIIVVPYFSPTSPLWQTIYDEAHMYPGTIKYVVINPCSGPCVTPLDQEWQDVISKLKNSGITTLGYVFNTDETFNNIDYYMKDPPVGTDGIFFDNEGVKNDLANFKQYSDYVHRLGGIAYINPGYNYSYVPKYLALGEADVINMHEVYSNSSEKITPNNEFPPWKTSVIIGNLSSSQEMRTDLSEVAGKGFGITYLYSHSYGGLPQFFSDEIAYASHTKVRAGK